MDGGGYFLITICVYTGNSLKSEERQQNRQWAAVTLFIVPSKKNVVFKVA